MSVSGVISDQGKLWTGVIRVGVRDNYGCVRSDQGKLWIVMGCVLGVIRLVMGVLVVGVSSG